MKKMKILFAIIGIILILEGVNTIYKGTHEENESTNVSVGESVSDKNGVSFCVTSVKDVTSIGENCITDGNFVLLTVKINNTGKTPYDVNTLRFKLIADDMEYEYYSDALFSLEDAMYMDTINPGIAKEYEIVYETPFAHTEKDTKLKILDNAYSSEGIFINLN